MSKEKMITKNEYNYREIEKKFDVVVPNEFEHFKNSPEVIAIEQLYLNHPDEPYSLRLREMTTRHGTTFSAALKDRGTFTPNGLDRLEIETEITATTYQYYKKDNFPTIHKLRCMIDKDISIDWIEGRKLPRIEIENPNSSTARRFYSECSDLLIEKTGESNSSSEAVAWAFHLESPDPLQQELSPEAIGQQIIALRTQLQRPIIVTIHGRSGSGKSTVTSQVQTFLKDSYSSLRLSTDDYHRGKAWLETTYSAPWTNWDAPEVYDTKAMNQDLMQLQSGQPIINRYFNFASQEPIHDGVTYPADIIIVEGIYAGSKDLSTQSDLHITVPTPLTTSIGRRLARDQREGRINTSLAKPEAILRYQLEMAEPMYQQQFTALPVHQQ
jgi:uridine kinase